VETCLLLLMRDGAVRVVFRPNLSAEQYIELLNRVERATTKQELREEMQAAAKAWNRKLEFDTDVHQ
jgi:hypothetical protein